MRSIYVVQVVELLIYMLFSRIGAVNTCHLIISDIIQQQRSSKMSVVIKCWPFYHACMNCSWYVHLVCLPDYIMRPG